MKARSSSTLKLSRWIADSGPRRAGISAFGIGGTNAHVVIEEARQEDSSPESRTARGIDASGTFGGRA